MCSEWGGWGGEGGGGCAEALRRVPLKVGWCLLLMCLSLCCRMYRRTSNMVGLSYPPSVIGVLQVLEHNNKQTNKQQASHLHMFLYGRVHFCVADTHT